MKTEHPADANENTETADSVSAAVKLVLREDSNELVAIIGAHLLQTGEDDLISLRKYLRREGFGSVNIDDATLVDLLRRARKGKGGESGEITLGVIEPGLSFSLDYEPDSGILFAVLEPSKRPPLQNTTELQECIELAGFGHFRISSGDLSAIITKIRQKQAGRYAIGKKSEYTNLRFRFDEDSKRLFADLFTSDAPMELSPAAAQTQLEQAGYHTFFIEPNALNKICEQARNNARGEFLLGERRDAGVSISFDDELMTAFISTSAPAGGSPLTREQLEKALVDANIQREFCDESALTEVLQKAQVQELPIARGIEAIEGHDASFEPLVSEVKYSVPKESKSGKIDLREIVNFTLIDENTPLMRRTPAQAGTNGRNVKGEIILAEEGLDTPFDENLPGVEISADDPNLLVSTCKGHPVILSHGVRVDNVITVNNVDMSTGNLNYDGSVLVKGEVKPGMRLVVTGDIVVKGVVTKAYLQAKNSITIECGVIGSDPAKDGADSPPAVIKAGGDISAQYFHQADIHAAGDVRIREYASHCTIEAKQHILAGQAGGKGKIFGGRAYARKGIYANSLGASGGTSTPVFAGYPPEQQKQFEQLLTSHKSRQQQQEKLRLLLKKYEASVLQNPTEIATAQKAVAIKKVLKELTLETEKMAATIKKINGAFKDSRKAEVRVSKDIASNVSISINGASFNVRQESKGGIFVKQGSDIRWMNYSKK